MAAGDIGLVIDTGMFNAVRGYWHRVVHVSGDVFAVAYQGPDTDGWLCTLTIDSAGGIGAVIDTLEFDAAEASSVRIIHVSGNIYAIAYWKTTLDDGVLKTVDIDNAGNIGAVIDTLTFDATRGRTPDIIHIAGDVFAIAYRGAGDDGWLGTVTIDNLGNIGAGFIDTLEFDGTYCSTPHVIHISGDVFAIAYVANTAWGYLKTVDIDSLGNIGAVIDSQAFIGASSCSDPRIIHVAGDVYAIAYNNPTADNHPGVLQTRTIDSAGDIGAGPLDSYQFIPRGIRPYIIHTSGDVFALAASGGTLLADSKGVLKTIHIANDGNIGAIIDTLNFEDPGGIDTPVLIPVAGDIYAIVYSYAVATGPGYVKTVSIETIVAPAVTNDPATAITANTATLNGTLDDDGGEACDCGFEWGETVAYGNTTPTQSRVTGQTFAQIIIGLDPHKTYHFRAFATNSAGTSYGADRMFITLGVVVPTVATNPETTVSSMATTLNGILDDDGGEACQCGFEWGKSVAYGTSTPTQSKNTGQTFSEIIAPLEPDTEYHFRAFAINSAGIGYGADRSFRTYPAMSRAYALSRSEL